MPTRSAPIASAVASDLDDEAGAVRCIDTGADGAAGGVGEPGGDGRELVGGQCAAVCGCPLPTAEGCEPSLMITPASWRRLWYSTDRSFGLPSAFARLLPSEPASEQSTQQRAIRPASVSESGA